MKKLNEILLINSNDVHNSQEFIDETYESFIFNSSLKIGNFYNSMYICRNTNTEKNLEIHLLLLIVMIQIMIF